MTKSRVVDEVREDLVCKLSRVYAGIFQDLAYAYPDDVDWFEKDQARLLRLVEQRGGYQVFLVDLPAAGKHLDQALAGGAYRCTGLTLTGKGPGHVQMPQFLRQLYLRVFDESGSLKEDCDVQALFFLRQVLYGSKRTKVQCSDENVEKEINEFVQVDKTLPEPEKFWSESDPPSSLIPETYRGFANSQRYRERVKQLPTHEEKVEATSFLVNLDVVSRFICAELRGYNPQSWRMRHGPGTISVKSHLANKYSFVGWGDRLESVYPQADYGFHDYCAWVDDVRIQSLKEFLAEGLPKRGPPLTFEGESYARLLDVPKTFSKPRLIAAEPGEHMWCQQNLKAYMYSRVEQGWISNFVRFRDQSLNQRLCLEGSRTGHLATVDLSAASDRVSCHAVGNLFRSRQEVLQALRASRTRYVQVTHKVPRDGRPLREFLELRKFSTMGSACTFPVETLMFLAATLAAVLTVRGLAPKKRNILALAGEVAVFGDDIVVPSDSRELLVRGLEVLDFKVNTQKSFWTGRFRESCGVDSYAGNDVTPAYYKSPYIKSTPETLATVVEVSNNFYQRFLVNSANAVASSLPWWARKSLPMVPMGSGICGVKSFVAPLPGASMGGKPLLKRWNRALQRMEYKAITLSGKSKCISTTDNTALLQFFTEEPDPFVHWTSGVKQRPSLTEKAKYLAGSAWVSS